MFFEIIIKNILFHVSVLSASWCQYGNELIRTLSRF